MYSYTEEYIYQVSLNYDDKVRIDNMPSDEYDDTIYSIVYQWCEETFGEESGDRWYHMYVDAYDSDTYCFKYEEDRTWFMIRWG